MPLFNWIKCTDGEIKYIRKSVTLEDEETEQDGEKWDKVFNEYIEKFGLGKLYKKTLEAMRKKALLELEYVQTGEQFKLTLIAIEAEKLKGMLNNQGRGITIEQAVIHLSKWLGYYINTKEITVIDYFTLLEEYGKANKKK